MTAGSALGADLTARKGLPALPPPPAALPPIWTGFYAGLNAGVGFSDSNQINTLGAPVVVGGFYSSAVANALAYSTIGQAQTGNGAGFVGGGQVGYNYQFFNFFLAGVEADIQGVAGSDAGKARAGVVSLASWLVPRESYASASTARQSVDYIGTVRGRFGWLALPTLLIYGTGGLAYGGVNMSTAFVAQETALPGIAGGTSYSDTRVGWVAGGGLEWLFLPSWSAKVEYQYYNLGNVTTTGVVTQATAAGAPLAAAATQTTVRFNGNLVRAGLNYHFNWAAPVPIVAKY
jgi:outer membrane immunogenic protein